MSVFCCHHTRVVRGGGRCSGSLAMPRIPGGASLSLVVCVSTLRPLVLVQGMRRSRGSHCSMGWSCRLVPPGDAHTSLRKTLPNPQVLTKPLFFPPGPTGFLRGQVSAALRSGRGNTDEGVRPHSHMLFPSRDSEGPAENPSSLGEGKATGDRSVSHSPWHPSHCRTIPYRRREAQTHLLHRVTDGDGECVTAGARFLAERTWWGSLV